MSCGVPLSSQPFCPVVKQALAPAGLLLMHLPTLHHTPKKKKTFQVEPGKGAVLAKEVLLFYRTQSTYISAPLTLPAQIKDDLV